MKAVVVLLAVCIFSIPLCFANPIYREHKGNTSISISESDKVYKLSATFNPDKTKQVQHYMNDAIGKDNNYSFSNTQLDATLTLDSKIKFYIKNNPGELVLRFNKTQNSAADFAKFKKMCEGIKDLLGKE